MIGKVVVHSTVQFFRGCLFFFFVILSQCTVAFQGVRGAAKICIAIDATERKRRIDTNLLAQRNAASTHESHHQRKLSNLPPYFLFLGRF